MPVDRTELTAVLDEFATTVTGDFTVAEVLRDLASGAARVLALTGAGVAVPDASGASLRHLYSTNGHVERLERLQELNGQGPCMDAHTSGRTVNLADVVTEGGWPDYQRLAHEVAVASVCAIPLVARDRSWGVLDLYRHEARALDEEELRVAVTLASLTTSYLVVAHDRDTARQAQDALRRHAVYDTLTGVPQRWFFLEQLDLSLRNLRRSQDRVGVLFLDLDGLKYVNDTFGHAAGDEFITVCVARIQAALRPGDVMARMGGDEFAVVLASIDEEHDAVMVGIRIRDSLQEHYHADGGRMRPSASVGVVVTDDPEATGAGLVAHADAAMYQAKRAGKGQVRLFDVEAYHHERNTRSAEETFVDELTDALTTGAIEPHYQPIFSTAPLQPVVAVEALLRWRHPARGLVTAGAFVDLAERYGLLPALGAAMRRTTCRQLADWDARLGRRAPRDLFVNVAPVELTDPGFVEAWQASLEEHGLAPHRVTFEITEGGLFTSDTSLQRLAELRALGCQLAIDDFGTGYSSLARLAEVPVQWIKIDRWFAHHLASQASAEAVVSATLVLAGRLGNDVVVEGVEDERTLRQLRALGVRFVQGFHLARPLSAEDLEALLTGHDRPGPGAGPAT